MGTHPKYSQARIYTTSAMITMIWIISVDWTAASGNKRRIANPNEDYASGSLHLAAVEENRW